MNRDLLARFLATFFFIYVVMLIPRIFYILTLRKALKKCAPASLTLDRGLIWIHLVPVAHLVFDFFIVLGMAKSLRNEFARRGLYVTDPMPGQAIGLSLCICACCSIIPLLGVLAALGTLVLWVVYWVKMADYSRLLDAQQPAMAVPSPA